MTGEKGKRVALACPVAETATMASSTPKVVLNASRDIPFNKLVLSQANVRQIKAGTSIAELAQDIARRGLLQSLNVRPLCDGEGQETGLFEVPAGGRRYRALEHLVTEKRLARTAPVPCIVQAHDTAPQEDSLAENLQRIAPHPLDQFRAFKVLREERGMSDEAIAAAFFITPTVVKQRLRLTAVSPKLLSVYAEDEMSLEQLMAFTVSSDPERQEKVWDAISRGYNKEPYLIRRLLTEGKVSASERRAVFVGATAYEAAGGIITRDLFQGDGGGWFEDPALLDRLVDEKLQAQAAAVVAEGWKWVEVARDFPWGHTHGMRRVLAAVEPPTPEQEARLEACYQEREGIEAEHHGTGEDLPDEVDRRLAELEAEIAALEERPGTYDPLDVAGAGAYLSLSHEGRVRIERGFVRPEDEPPADGVAGQEDGMADQGGTGPQAAITVGDGAPIAAGAAASALEADEGDARRPLPERLVTELTAFRTLGLREALAGNPDVAQLAVLHALALKAFYGPSSYDPGSCLEIEAKSAALPVASAIALNETAAAKALTRRHEAWAQQLPRQAGELWDWLLACDADTRATLLAYCAARTLNSTHHAHERRPAALAHAVRLAEALALDLSDQWAATPETYLGRITKAQIREAVREAKGEAAAQMIDPLKKAEMALEAERLLKGTGWLPALLRTPGLADTARHAETPGEAVGPGPDADAGGRASRTLPPVLADEATTDAALAPAGPGESAYGIAAE